MKWAKQPAPRTPPAVFLYGPPGVGKTTLAHRVVTDAGLRPVECNASQFRHKAAMSELIEPLLNSANVSDFFRPEGHRALGIILDEIDGMSAGDRGGLSELVRIMKNYTGPNVIICISNEWQEKRYQPIMRMCMCLPIQAPDLESCIKWMGQPIDVIQPLWERHQGDLRKLLQWQAGASLHMPNDITRGTNVHDIVMRLLHGEMDIQEDLHLDNNDLNLAGLHLHETLPEWIHEHYTEAEDCWQIYMDCLGSIATSDRQDYYTFFHQHWSLFPLSFQSKLQAVNHKLFVSRRPTKNGKNWKFQYTAVLARQSWLFNQFKYLCEMRDTLETANGATLEGGLEMSLWIASLLHTIDSDGSHLLPSSNILPIQITTPKDRIQRWLHTLMVQPVPPCPIGEYVKDPIKKVSKIHKGLTSCFIPPSVTDLTRNNGEEKEKKSTRKPREPKAKEPKAKEPKAKEPKAKEPKVKEPKAKEPKVKEPKAKEPKVKEPKAKETKAKEPKAKKEPTEPTSKKEPVPKK
jgi:DNA polymerase III delta prime subunit